MSPVFSVGAVFNGTGDELVSSACTTGTLPLSAIAALAPARATVDRRMSLRLLDMKASFVFFLRVEFHLDRGWAEAQPSRVGSLTTDDLLRDGQIVIRRYNHHASQRSPNRCR